MSRGLIVARLGRTNGCTDPGERRPEVRSYWHGTTALAASASGEGRRILYCSSSDPDLRLWRIDRRARYGPLDGLARNHVNTRLIAEHRDEICRLTASLRAGTVVPPAILRTLQRGPAPSSLARALAELGRVIKTLHVLEYVHDPAYRRTIHHMHSRGERRNSLARDVFHGQRGQLRKHYQAGQENQLDSLGIMVNVIVLWQTACTQAALEHLAASGYPLDPADVARLTPSRPPHGQPRCPVPDHQPTTRHRTPAATNRLTQDPVPILVTGRVVRRGRGCCAR